MNKQTYFDGANLKAINAWDVDNMTGWTNLSGGADNGTPQATVAYLYACINARAKAVSAVPFCVYKGDTEYENSDDYENKTGFMPDPYRLMFLMEAALVCYGRNYLFKQRNNSRVLGLQYLLPTSVTPKFKPSKNGGVDISFERVTSTNGTLTLTTDDIVYMWLPDPAVEIGEPTSYPLRAALAAAGAISSIDTFAAKYFERGMVKATIFGVPGSTPQEEKVRIENWVNKTLGGIKNAWRNIVANVDEFKPTVIGGGLDEVKNIAALTDGLQASITYAMGIPESYLTSGSAAGLGGGGVASADVLKFYDNTIVPDCKIIQGALNEQLYKPLGLRFEFEPERMPVYQRDIAPAISALSQLISAINVGLSPDKLAAAINIVGLDVSEEDLALLMKQEPKPEPPAPPMPEQVSAEEADEHPAPISADVQKAVMELGQWERFIARAGGNPSREFEARYIPAHIAAQIRENVKTRDYKEVIAEAAKSLGSETHTPSPQEAPAPAPPPVDYSPLLAGIEAAMKALDVSERAYPAPQISVTVHNAAPDMPAPSVEVKAGDIILPEPNIVFAPTFSPNNNIDVASTPIENNITVQPAPVKIPAPGAVEVINDPKTGRTTLRPIKAK